MKCFNYNQKNNKQCNIKSCRYWMSHNESLNCCINFKQKEKITLEEIGNIFNVTRMRICQIEKLAISNLKKIISKKMSANADI